MVAYSFKGRFVGPIESRSKRQTIRGIGKKRHARPGDKVQIYTGDRFHPRKVGEAVCESAGAISLIFESEANRAHAVITTPSGNIVLRRDARYSDGPSLDEFAQADGFDDWTALEAFWRETHSPLPAEWTGILITWGDSFAPTTAGAAA